MYKEQVHSALVFITEVTAKVDCTVYIRIVTPLAGIEGRVRDPKEAVDLLTAPAQINADLEAFLLTYSGGVAARQINNTYVAASENCVVAIMGDVPEYSRFFAFLVLYALENSVAFRHHLNQDGIDYFYIATQNPHRLLTFVLLGYPEVRSTHWKLQEAATNSIYLPREGGGINLIASSI